MALVKESKTTSSSSKADKKRSNKHQHLATASAAAAVTNPYSGKRGKKGDDDESLSEQSDDEEAPAHFIVFEGKELSFDSFLDVLNDKHSRFDAIKWLFSSKLKAYNLTSSGSDKFTGSSGGTLSITTAMAEKLLDGIRGALGFGGGGGGSKKKKSSASGEALPSAEAEDSRIAAIECGTTLVLNCAADPSSRHLFDCWGKTLVAIIISIVKAIRSQMEDYAHAANTVEGPVKALVASPSGLASGASAAHRRALAEIAGKAYRLLVKCFEALALLAAVDPDMTVNEEGESLPTALLQIIPLAIPDFASVPVSGGGGNAFPTEAELTESNSGNNNALFLPVEASGALVKCLASSCDPAQGPKTRAAILRLLRFVTNGKTAVQETDSRGDDEDFDSRSNGTSQPAEENAAEGDAAAVAEHHKTSYLSLVRTYIVDVAEAIGILSTRFPDMVGPEEDTTVGSPTGLASPSSQPFTITPFFSVSRHLVPLAKIVTTKAFGRGKGKREALGAIRITAKKLASINGSNASTVEYETENLRSPGHSHAHPHTHMHFHHSNKGGHHKISSGDATPSFSPSSGCLSPVSEGFESAEKEDKDALPSFNPNRAHAAEEEAAAAAAAAAAEELISGTVAPAATDDADGTSDPREVIQFRDKISVPFVGFHQIYIASCLRSFAADGLQRQLAQNPAVRTLFGIKEDLTRKVDRGERREHLLEAEASKMEERRERQKERDSKARAREGLGGDDY